MKIPHVFGDDYEPVFVAKPVHIDTLILRDFQIQGCQTGGRCNAGLSNQCGGDIFPCRLLVKCTHTSPILCFRRTVSRFFPLGLMKSD